MGRERVMDRMRRKRKEGTERKTGIEKDKER